MFIKYICLYTQVMFNSILKSYIEHLRILRINRTRLCFAAAKLKRKFGYRLIKGQNIFRFPYFNR